MLQQINGNTIVCISSFAAQTDDKFIIQELNIRRTVLNFDVKRHTFP